MERLEQLAPAAILGEQPFPDILSFKYENKMIFKIYNQVDTVEADWVMERLEQLAPAAILGEQPFFIGWGLHR